MNREKLEGWKRKTTPPIVIDRYHFKEDRAGYLGHQYTHIGVFDIATKTAEDDHQGHDGRYDPVVVA